MGWIIHCIGVVFSMKVYNIFLTGIPVLDSKRSMKLHPPNFLSNCIETSNFGGYVYMAFSWLEIRLSFSYHSRIRLVLLVDLLKFQNRKCLLL